MEDSNCCPPDQDANSTCCPKSTPSEVKNKKGMKKKIGMFLMSLALVVGISSAFKTATSGVPNKNETNLLKPQILKYF